jgi:hypothetical protein
VPRIVCYILSQTLNADEPLLWYSQGVVWLKLGMHVGREISRHCACHADILIYTELVLGAVAYSLAEMLTYKSQLNWLNLRSSTPAAPFCLFVPDGASTCLSLLFIWFIAIYYSQNSQIALCSKLSPVAGADWLLDFLSASIYSYILCMFPVWIAKYASCLKSASSVPIACVLGTLHSIP